MADINNGLWFQSAVSGLYYQEHDAAGDVMCVILNGVHYYSEFSNREQENSADRLCTCKDIEHVQGCEYWGLPNNCYYGR